MQVWIFFIHITRIMGREFLKLLC